MQPIRLLIVDDQPLLRAGLAMILRGEPDLELVDEASNGKEAVAAAKSCRPDVVLMDVRMPEMDGVEATAQITALPDNPSVIILTTFDLDEYVYAALRAGASGFLLKDAPSDQLLDAVRTVAAGDALLAPSVTKRLIGEFTRVAPAAQETPAWHGELTDREHEVLSLMATGLSNAEIASSLILGETTVKTHVSRVLAKLGARDRVQAVVAAYEAGVVTPGSPPPS